MIYKFNTNSLSNRLAYLEISHENGVMRIESGDTHDEQMFMVNYLPKNEIDNLIIALTNIKNEISEYERSELS